MEDSHQMMLTGMGLQNDYAHAVDARDWALFSGLFAANVTARYPHRTYRGVAKWVEDFEPFHAACTWTMHQMSNHRVGEDGDGWWASCYGQIQWVRAKDRAGTINRSRVIYRDRLARGEAGWVITHRRLDLLAYEAEVPRPVGLVLNAAIHERSDCSVAAHVDDRPAPEA